MTACRARLGALVGRATRRGQLVLALLVLLAALPPGQAAAMTYTLTVTPSSATATATVFSVTLSVDAALNGEQIVFRLPYAASGSQGSWPVPTTATGNGQIAAFASTGVTHPAPTVSNNAGSQTSCTSAGQCAVTFSYVYATQGAGTLGFTYAVDAPPSSSSGTFSASDDNSLYVQATVSISAAAPTATDVPTALPTDTPSATPTNTPIPTATSLPTNTPTNTPSPTNTPTATATNTPTATATSTVVPTPSDTSTPGPAQYADAFAGPSLNPFWTANLGSGGSAFGAAGLTLSTQGSTYSTTTQTDPRISTVLWGDWDVSVQVLAALGQPGDQIGLLVTDASNSASFCKFGYVLSDTAVVQLQQGAAIVSSLGWGSSSDPVLRVIRAGSTYTLFVRDPTATSWSEVAAGTLPGNDPVQLSLFVESTGAFSGTFVQFAVNTALPGPNDPAALTPTATATNTTVPTPTSTATSTYTPTSTPSPTNTPTESPTASPTDTPTNTVAPTNTPLPATPTPTPGPFGTPTFTPSASPTTVPVSTTAPTDTPIPSPTATASASPLATPSPEPTASPLPTPTSTASATSTAAPTASATGTASPTATATFTASSTATATSTASATASATPTTTPTLTPSPTSLPVPLGGGVLHFALPSGQPAAVSFGADTMAQLQAAGIQVAVAFDGQPAGATDTERGALGGGTAQAVGPPLDIRVSLTDASGNSATAAGLPVATDITLPVLAAPSDAGTFAWLEAVYAEDGQFVGYVRPSAAFDPSTGMLTLHLSLDGLRGTLFLPVVVHVAYVQNFDPLVHIYSGPTAQAEDFGIAAPQFTTFPVVSPQVAQRLYVFNPASGNYGWIDVAGVGPAGPPPR